MKKILFSLVCIFGFMTLAAQQEHQYTQWMQSKLTINPAYAGANFSPCLTGIYRNQWIGFDKAPQTQQLSYDQSLANDRVGIGANLYRNSVGITEYITFDGIYSYRFPVGNGFLGVGVQASIRNLSMDYGDEDLRSTQDLGQDIAVPLGTQLSKFVPDFGLGLYYNTSKFYFGASVPRLLNNDIDLQDPDGQIGREVAHGYVMAGYKIRLTEKLELLPQALVKYANNSPLDIDLNASLLIQDKYTLGANYRFGGDDESLGESIAVLLGAQFTSQIFAGLSWDFTLSEIRNNTNGSLEIALRYCFEGNESEDFANPRFF
jgi:type IX secretion system PorP/SprF family membrane protein